MNDRSAEACVRCGRALYSLTEGELLSGRYAILGILGRGGMGVVYRAHDRELDERVAVKILRSAYATSPEALRRLQAEIKLARKVRDPRVCAIHEFGREDHIAYIVMELVDGQDLQCLLQKQGRLRATEVCEMAAQLCQALEAIHAAGIVHRDLKTANVMVDRCGVVRLMDFGIAKAVGAARGTLGTAPGQLIGTPEYMSPEQARGDRVDYRSDLYALGVILFELATGLTPVRGEDPVDTMRRQMTDEPDWGAQPARDLPATLRSVLARALAKNPAERFQTAREMREALAPLHAEVGAGDGLRALGGSASPTALQPGARAPRDSATEGSGSTLQEATPSAARSTADAGRRRRPRELWLGAVLTLGLAGVGLVWLTRDRRTEATGGAATPATSPRAVQAVTTPPEIAAPTPEALAPGAMERRTPLSRRAVPVAPAPGPSQPAASPTSPTGRLALLVVPWAEVSVDGRSLGTTPLRPFDLAAGRHTVVLTHPAYEPVRRQLVIVAGETTTLEVDLGDVGFPKAR